MHNTKSGRPRSKEFDELICGKFICAKKDNSIKIKDSQVETIFKSKVRAFTKSGGYIPASGNYENRHVYVVVMKK